MSLTISVLFIQWHVKMSCEKNVYTKAAFSVSFVMTVGAR